MKSPVQRLLWERKLELLERRPVPAAPEVNRYSLRRFAYMLIRSEPMGCQIYGNDFSGVTSTALVVSSPRAQQLKELANLAAQGMADTLRRWK